MYFLIPNQMVIFILKPQFKTAGISEDNVASYTLGSATCQQPDQDQSRSVFPLIYGRNMTMQRSVPCPVGEGLCRFITIIKMKITKC